jgi:ubiquinone/menaquinone biosynthesis C-methylase UbiE
MSAFGAAHFARSSVSPRKHESTKRLFSDLYFMFSCLRGQIHGLAVENWDSTRLQYSASVTVTFESAIECRPMDDGSITAATQRFYTALARHSPELAFLNYGFVDPATPPNEMQAADLVTACRGLYDAVLSPFSEADRVLEVGCGRGGGAAFVLESRLVAQYLGLDLSREHVRMCRKRLSSQPAAHFAVADAARLPLQAARFDAAFSIEAVHHFENRDRFYREVARALRPRGRFFLASLWRRSEVESTEAFEAGGFTVVERADITANVLASLSRSSGLRREMVASLNLPEHFIPLLMSWAGVSGYDAYQSLESGALQYLRYRLVRN